MHANDREYHLTSDSWVYVEPGLLLQRWIFIYRKGDDDFCTSLLEGNEEKVKVCSRLKMVPGIQ